MTTQKKYYVVWEGKFTGVFDTWDACKQQVNGYDGAKYKSFPSKIEANTAFSLGYTGYYKKHAIPKKITNPIIAAQKGEPILNSLCVDAACNMTNGTMEYRGVHTGKREQWFIKGPFVKASNNIGEFLALVHGLALLKQMNLNIPIYSDSITAIAWVRHKKHKSIVLPTEENELIFDLLQRAENWLHANHFSNPILKWETKIWGEIPADFGRK